MFFSSQGITYTDMFFFLLQARENDNSQDESKITATTLVTITVLDVNDNSPTFNSLTYEAFILENMQKGVPITFSGPNNISFLNAFDRDQVIFSFI